MTATALAGKSVIVTGASSGIGLSTALLAARQGASVTLVGRDRARLEEARVQAEAQGGRAVAVAGDLADEALLGEVAGAAAQAFGRIDGLVHNASVVELETVDALTAASLGRQWRVNVAAPLLLTREALPYMGAGGSIVVISSTAALRGLGGIAGYAATKGAVAAAARSLADELAPRGIRVNVVSPGWVRTPMVAPQFEADPAFAALIASRSLVGRVGEPEDIAATIAFLLSDAAAYVNGTEIVADGGAISSMALR